MNPDLLIGEELTSVEFMQTQLTLHFGDNTLTLNEWPLIADADGISIAHGEPGYSDALCFLVGLSVEKATYTEGVELTMEFDNSTVIALSLREEDMESTEAGSFITGSGVYEF
ncbi:MAG: hypothetical protein JSS87_08520 [Acidobacteria bacterium]|nr:hypothetical protein [Acidobacteriota bacterium]